MLYADANHQVINNKMIALDNPESSKLALVDKQILAQFLPVSRLSPRQLNKLGEVCFVKKISKGLDPRRLYTSTMEALYLVEGDLDIQYENGNNLVFRGGTDTAKYPINSTHLKVKSVVTLTPVKVVCIDVGQLDIMLTWDRISGYKPTEAERN